MFPQIFIKLCRCNNITDIKVLMEKNGLDIRLFRVGWCLLVGIGCSNENFANKLHLHHQYYDYYQPSCTVKTKTSY
jgi:hypothetical protein